MKFAISITTPEVKVEAPLALLDGTFEEKLKKAKAYGYDGVELVTNDPACLDVEELKMLLRRYDLKAAAVASGCIAATRGLTLVSPDGETRQRAAALLHELIAFAGKLEARVVTIGSFRGSVAAAGSQTDALMYLDEALLSADARAGMTDVCLALEPINPTESDFLTTAAETLHYISERGFSHVKLLLDTYHVFLAEENPFAALRDSAPHLAHVHLADSRRLPVGMGSIDFDGVESVLRDIGYAGWQGIELARAPTPDLNGETTIRNIRQVIASAV